MRKITFYRQERMDRGLRTGVEVDGTTVLGLYESLGDDCDPGLSWYVDVRCQGSRLPTEPEQARRWLLEQTSVVRQGLKNFAERLRAGMDFDSWPLLSRIPRAPRGVTITIACSAVRRLAARDIARVLVDIADHWERRLRSLRANEPVPA